MKKVIFSGIQPSAQAPHLGNYLGAFKQWVGLQKTHQAYYCVVDLHAISTPQDAKELKQAIYATYALLLSVGIDPKLSNIFVQSHNPAHTELAWLLNCYTHIGELNRMTQFKEKSQKQKKTVTAGLYDYPVLMAADILLYDTEIVPVGADQVQHIELARDIAVRFNNLYGETFKLPQSKLITGSTRIMNLQKPQQKMSKSDSNPNGVIFLLDKPDQIRKKVMSAVTDSQKTIIFDVKRPGLYNLLSIYKALTNKSEDQIVKHFQNQDYKGLKTELSELIINLLKPIQKKYDNFVKDKTGLELLMRQNAEKTKKISSVKVREVKQKIGLIV